MNGFIVGATDQPHAPSVGCICGGRGYAHQGVVPTARHLFHMIHHPAAKDGECHWTPHAARRAAQQSSRQQLLDGDRVVNDGDVHATEFLHQRLPALQEYVMASEPGDHGTAAVAEPSGPLHNGGVGPHNEDVQSLGQRERFRHALHQQGAVLTTGAVRAYEHVHRGQVGAEKAFDVFDDVVTRCEGDRRRIHPALACVAAEGRLDGGFGQGVHHHVVGERHPSILRGPEPIRRPTVTHGVQKVLLRRGQGRNIHGLGALKNLPEQVRGFQQIHHLVEGVIWPWIKHQGRKQKNEVECKPWCGTRAGTSSLSAAPLARNNASANPVGTAHKNQSRLLEVDAYVV